MKLSLTRKQHQLLLYASDNKPLYDKLIKRFLCGSINEQHAKKQRTKERTKQLWKK